MQKAIFHETKTHGQLTFPYTVYRGNIPEYIRSYPLHWHDEMELIYICNGQGMITIQSHQYLVGTGDILIILPQMVHSIEQYHDMKMEYFNILFQFSMLTCSVNDPCYEKYLKPLYEHTRVPSLYLKSDSDRNHLLSPHITYLIENRKHNDELMIKARLFAILHHINQDSNPVSPTDRSLENNYDKLKELLLHVQSNYDSEITVKQAAAICGFSQSHFMKLFKEMTGKSFSQYLIRCRLEAAARQLSETPYTVTDIAANVGFHNLSYFSRAFYAKYGKTPSAYRACSSIISIAKK